MKKNILSKITVSAALALAFIIALPQMSQAATVYIESSRDTISVGDTAIISVKLNADGAVLNTVDGNITFKSGVGALAVKEFSLGNSVLGLWPRTPSLSVDGRTISFVGGVPGGFSIEGATLFKIIVEAQKEGTITLSPQTTNVFVNDGKGTPVPATSKDFTLKVVAKKAGEPVQNEWDGVMVEDTIAPEDFIIVLGQDAALYEGKKFAFFSAVDQQSGVSYYEVSENGAPVVKSGSTYVLQNQDDSTKLVVTAYDKAGNKKTASYPAEGGTNTMTWVLVTIIVLAILAGIYLRSLKKRKNNVSGTL